MLSLDRYWTYSDRRVRNVTGHPHVKTGVQHMLLGRLVEGRHTFLSAPVALILDLKN